MLLLLAYLVLMRMLLLKIRYCVQHAKVIPEASPSCLPAVRRYTAYMHNNIKAREQYSLKAALKTTNRLLSTSNLGKRRFNSPSDCVHKPNVSIPFDYVAKRRGVGPDE